MRILGPIYWPMGRISISDLAILEFKKRRHSKHWVTSTNLMFVFSNFEADIDKERKYST